jgi:signal transduction histidine kinase
MLTSRYAMWMGWGPELGFFYNDAYARMTLGAKHPWALGRPASEVWAEIWGDIGPRIEHVLATGEATWDEGLLLFLERSGFPEETYHTFSYSPLHDDDGRVAGMFCVVTEETTRIIGERRLTLLRELASQLSSSQTTDDVWLGVQRALQSNARDLPFALVYLANADDGRLQLVASSNVRRGEAMAPEILDPSDPVWPFRQFMESDTQKPVTVERPASASWPCGPWPKPPSRAIVLPLPQQGHARPAGVFVGGLNPYRPFDGEYASFLSLYVGQLAAGLANAQAYAAERRRAEALAQVDRAKTTFFSNVSHELRTPLTLMLGPVSDALADVDRSLAGEALELVHRNGLRLQKLVNTLLDFSRIEAGRMDASYEPLDLASFTFELASAFDSAVVRAGLRLVVDCRTGGEPTYVDRDMWEKVVLNLLSNAFKFTFEGEIGVSVFQSADRAVLRVRDTGTGIPASELPRIFERFHRVDGSRGRTHEGTGIGLALVHELVKLHGGSIEVESEANRGTIFTVAIPLGTAHLPADRIRRERRLERTAVNPDAYVAEAARWLPGVTPSADEALDVPGVVAADGVSDALLVLADDNADMRAYLRGLLGTRWRLELAADGEEALRLARTLAPDAVITDVMMPRLDGVGLLRELRAHPATRHIPVMLLSARAGEEARVEGFEAGADDYIVKPFTARELVARVHAQLLRARIRRVEDEHRRRIAAVFTHAPVAIAILHGPSHVFELANPPYLQIVGRQALVGQAVREALPELEGQQVMNLLDQVYQSAERYVGRSHPVKLRRGQGETLEECFFDFVFQPIFDASGQVNGIAVVAFEVTELVRARRAAEEASRAKDEFLAMLGHELRNPLAPILTALQLLRIRGETGGAHERAVIERQARHLVGLVDDLLDVSRITRGKVRLKLSRVELHDVVVRGIELASPLLEQHQHELFLEIADRGLPVLADTGRLAQVVGNLLTNAAKYTPAGGRIQLSAREEDGQVVLRVADTGIGIDAEMLPQVFDLFAQDRQAIDRAQGGLGLGLAIVRSLVSLHGGSVSARSEGRGRGSEFVIRLPRAGADGAAAAGEAERVAHEAIRTARRVLIVDDNVDAASLLAELLSELGHATEWANDGPSALAAAARFRPDLALLDIGLPVMDGFELARQMRRVPELPRLRLVAVTGYGQEHDRVRAAEAGFDAHLVKPVHVEQLAPLLQQLAQRRD